MLRGATAVKRKAGRPTSAASADLRTRILETAIQEFLEKGFGGASIEGIARAANVTKDTLYRQFGSKEQLYRASVWYGLKIAPHGERRPVHRSGDPESVLASILQRIYTQLTDPRNLAITRMSIAQASLFPDLAATTRADTHEYLWELADYLKALRDAGTLTLDDPQEAAELLAICTLGGVRFLFDEPLRGAALDAYIQRLLTLFLRGWSYRPRAASPATGSEPSETLGDEP